ncbi:Hypothetical protein BC94_0649 [Mycoplasmopsis bovis]|uniref:Uncharacterized protein n=1 Tax=Mycoplasmopsis bovis TaxID=28903 RepID=A0A8D4DA69_MYCBV|nr:Hypothetical protein BC85_0646 [Mycoplasmopsis bovis]AMW25891.1 Hypothetical protein BC94_0649 [Mycoplasmopsis bovis]AMW26521.1 Hypothetical protein BC93_0647 [Mycoplasmopsis bovis]
MLPNSFAIFIVSVIVGNSAAQIQVVKSAPFSKNIFPKTLPASAIFPSATIILFGKASLSALIAFLPSEAINMVPTSITSIYFSTFFALAIASSIVKLSSAICSIGFIKYS